MQEIWKDIKGHEGYYQVSNKGRIRSVDRKAKIGNGNTRTVKGRIMKTDLSNSGYLRVCGCRDCKKFKIDVHRAVAEAFIPNPEDNPQTNHKDGVKTNNHVDNLEWATRSENQRHAFKNGLKNMPKGSTHHASKLTEDDVRDIKKYLEDGLTQSTIADYYGVASSVISRINTGKAWAHV